MDQDHSKTILSTNSNNRLPGPGVTRMQNNIQVNGVLTCIKLRLITALT